jgi:hypothetical protein
MLHKALPYTQNPKVFRVKNLNFFSFGDYKKRGGNKKKVALNDINIPLYIDHKAAHPFPSSIPSQKTCMIAA